MTKIDEIAERLKEKGVPVTMAKIVAVLLCLFVVSSVLCSAGVLPPEVDNVLAEILYKLSGGLLDFRGMAVGNDPLPQNNTTPTSTVIPVATATGTPPPATETATPTATATPTETTPVETPKPTEAPTEPTEAPSAAETATPTVNETTPTATPTVNTTVTEPESSVVPSFPNATAPSPLVPTTIYPVKLC